MGLSRSNTQFVISNHEKGCQCIIVTIILLLGTWLLASGKRKIQCSCLTVRDMIKNTIEQKKARRVALLHQMNGY